MPTSLIEAPNSQRTLDQALTKILSSPIFKNTRISADFIQKALQDENSGLSIATIPMGKTLIQEGDRICPSFYLFICGGFSISIHGQHITDTKNEIEVIGEVGFLDPAGGRIATVTGKESNNTVIRIGKPFFRWMLHDKNSRISQEDLAHIYHNLTEEMLAKLARTNRIIRNFELSETCAKKLDDHLQKPLIQWIWTSDNDPQDSIEIAKKSEIFKWLSPESFQNIIDNGKRYGSLRTLIYEPWERIFSSSIGHPDCCYIVLQWGVHVYDKDRLVGSIGRTGVFWESLKSQRIAEIKAIDSWPDTTITSSENPGQTILMQIEKRLIDSLAPEIRTTIYRNLAINVGKTLNAVNRILLKIQQELSVCEDCRDVTIQVNQEITRLM